MNNFLLNIFFPEYCIGCKKPGVSLCALCKSAITFAESPEEPNLIAIFDYANNLVRDILWQCKYHHKTGAYEELVRAAAPYIADAVAEKVMSERTSEILLVPIPQWSGRTIRRGYNQSTLTAKILAKVILGSSVQDILKKVVETIPQAKLRNKKDREKNVLASMHYKKRVNPKQIYIVVDDVTTTGATLREAMRALRDAGAVHILGVAIAHGYRR